MSRKFTVDCSRSGGRSSLRVLVWSLLLQLFVFALLQIEAVDGFRTRTHLHVGVKSRCTYFNEDLHFPQVVGVAGWGVLQMCRKRVMMSSHEGSFGVNMRNVEGEHYIFNGKSNNARRKTVVRRDGKGSGKGRNQRSNRSRNRSDKAEMARQVRVENHLLSLHSSLSHSLFWMRHSPIIF